MRESGRVTYRGKRTLDLLCAGAACLVFAPLVASIAVSIWLDDRGTPFFTQTRIGQGRRPFRILKFRTMRAGVVTRVGHWLRRTGLDELPQFVNVCRGDMSVVGPRPLTQEDIERLHWSTAAHDWRFALKPGITGSAQLAGGRNARDTSRLERLYLHNQGIALDICIVALSFAANLIGKTRVRAWIRPARRRA